MAKTNRSKKKARNSWTRTLVGILLIASAGIVGMLLLRDYLNSRPVQLVPATESFAARFEQTLKEALVPPEAVRLESRRTEQTAEAIWNVYRYDVEVPATLALNKFGNLLRDAVRNTGVTVQDTFESDREVSLSMQIANREFLIARLHTSAPETVAAVRPTRTEHSEPTPDAAEQNADEHGIQALLPWSWLPRIWRNDKNAPVFNPASPQLAIILDDGGYGGKATDEVLDLDPRLTLAILPYTPHATDSAERGFAKGFQIMLHMPMESGTSNDTFEGTIVTSMDEATIDRLLQQALDQVPHAQGINNHTGSTFSAHHDACVMMLEGLRRRGLFFIDSRTIHTSVAMETACAMGVPAGQRDVFLDHENSREFIERQWDELVSLCRERGSAIGIGHFRELTAEILAEKLPQLDDYGIELVHAGDLARCER